MVHFVLIHRALLAIENFPCFFQVLLPNWCGVVKRVIQRPTMSSTASTSKPAETTPKPAEEPKKDESQLHLGVLEEDDEFEEFPVAGAYFPRVLDGSV
jgi:hypothetical protein